ncbi:hypothetical protein [Hyphomicrobium sp. MC1]|uniref:hypothetical protein n=1 Tax=Hyphomicrobium sp. (strain MC1) TaxID=717785 RepID=UPI000213EFE4|nr:hypothetical protein [Hyphomicrobium sp. MC1]CCB66689.1 protein of unknown function [Hyphomicrobium sp. MC1]
MPVSNLNISATSLLSVAGVADKPDAAFRFDDKGEMTVAPRSLFGKMVAFITGKDKSATEAIASGLLSDLQDKYGFDIGLEAFKLARPKDGAFDYKNPIKPSQVTAAKEFAASLTLERQCDDAVRGAKRYASGDSLVKIARMAGVDLDSLSGQQKEHFKLLLGERVSLTPGWPMLARGERWNQAAAVLKRVAAMTPEQINASVAQRKRVDAIGKDACRWLAEQSCMPEEEATALHFARRSYENEFSQRLAGLCFEASQLSDEIGMADAQGAGRDDFGDALMVSMTHVAEQFSPREARQMFEGAMAEGGAGRLALFAAAGNVELQSSEAKSPFIPRGESAPKEPRSYGGSAVMLQMTTKTLLLALARRGGVEGAWDNPEQPVVPDPSAAAGDIEAAGDAESADIEAAESGVAGAWKRINDVESAGEKAAARALKGTKKELRSISKQEAKEAGLDSAAEANKLLGAFHADTRRLSELRQAMEAEKAAKAEIKLSPEQRDQLTAAIISDASKYMKSAGFTSALKKMGADQEAIREIRGAIKAELYRWLSDPLTQTVLTKPLSEADLAGAIDTAMAAQSVMIDHACQRSEEARRLMAQARNQMNNFERQGVTDTLETFSVAAGLRAVEPYERDDDRKTLEKLLADLVRLKIALTPPPAENADGNEVEDENSAASKLGAEVNELMREISDLTSPNPDVPNPEPPPQAPADGVDTWAQGLKPAEALDYLDDLTEFSVQNALRGVEANKIHTLMPALEASLTEVAIVPGGNISRGGGPIAGVEEIQGELSELDETEVPELDRRLLSAEGLSVGGKFWETVSTPNMHYSALRRDGLQTALTTPTQAARELSVAIGNHRLAERVSRIAHQEMIEPFVQRLGATGGFKLGDGRVGEPMALAEGAEMFFAVQAQNDGSVHVVNRTRLALGGFALADNTVVELNPDRSFVDIAFVVAIREEGNVEFVTMAPRYGYQLQVPDNPAETNNSNAG